MSSTSNFIQDSAPPQFSYYSYDFRMLKNNNDNNNLQVKTIIIGFELSGIIYV